jgi:hypothetical protein
MLSAIPGLKVVPITSSCCGMAGAFGYERKNLEASKAMAELSLLPHIGRRRRRRSSSPTAPPAATRSAT